MAVDTPHARGLCLADSVAFVAVLVVDYVLSAVSSTGGRLVGLLMCMAGASAVLFLPVFNIVAFEQMFYFVGENEGLARLGLCGDAGQGEGGDRRAVFEVVCGSPLAAAVYLVLRPLAVSLLPRFFVLLVKAQSSSLHPSCLCLGHLAFSALRVTCCTYALHKPYSQPM